MSLSTLSLAIFLILFAVVSFGWVAISGVVLGIFALIAGVLLILGEANIYPRK